MADTKLETCPRCDGTGYEVCDRCNGAGDRHGGNVPCDVCDGDGVELCDGCNGTGGPVWGEQLEDGTIGRVAPLQEA